MISGYIKCPCDHYQPGPDGICVEPECGHDAHQHVFAVGPNEACAAQEGDEPGCYLPNEDDQAECFAECCYWAPGHRQSSPNETLPSAVDRG